MYIQVSQFRSEKKNVLLHFYFTHSYVHYLDYNILLLLINCVFFQLTYLSTNRTRTIQTAKFTLQGLFNDPKMRESSIPVMPLLEDNVIRF